MGSSDTGSGSPPADGSGANGSGERGLLAGVRVLALEQMQALPFATQLLARLGADVVKVERPRVGDAARGALPAIEDPYGRLLGATFLCNNLNKRSVCIDLQQPAGRDLVLRMAPRFDVFAENFKPGAIARLGLGYDDLAVAHPSCVYVAISGFGTLTASPYTGWPAFAAVAEAMSGVYEAKRGSGRPPRVAPVGGLGDISAALFAAVGILSALRDRDRTGNGHFVDVAMLDAVLAMTDSVVNLWSMGLDPRAEPPLIMHGFRAADGWFVIQVGREHQFARLAEVVGEPGWTQDPRLADRAGWIAHLESVIRPGVERWSARRSKLDVCQSLAGAGVAAGPCFAPEEIVADAHVTMRRMLVEIPHSDPQARAVLVPGNPVKVDTVDTEPDRRVPWLGEHTDEVLRAEAAVDDDELAALRAAGVVT